MCSLNFLNSLMKIIILFKFCDFGGGVHLGNAHCKHFCRTGGFQENAALIFHIVCISVMLSGIVDFFVSSMSDIIIAGYYRTQIFGYVQPEGWIWLR